MNHIELVQHIASFLASEVKSYDIPDICSSYGLDDGEESEAFAGKSKYVERRLRGKDQLFLIDLAKRVAKDYNSVDLNRMLNTISPRGIFNITQITRKNIVKEILSLGYIEGDMNLIDFLKRTWDLDSMPSTDSRFFNATGDITQHMIANDDWSFQELFEDVLEIYNIKDEKFIRFTEQIVHPRVRSEVDPQFIEKLNYHLVKDGYKMQVTSQISGYPLYTIIKTTKGVKGEFKNLIFAADGPKPEIVISDSINNEIAIVKNQEFCLVYDLPILEGLLWRELVTWWGDKQSEEEGINVERAMYKRLIRSLDKGPERNFFKFYFKHFRERMGNSLPALIPQVYLHYDPYVTKIVPDETRLVRQRMDFLLLLPNNVRIVIEIDGKQHYSSEDNKPNPKKYAEMMKADRDLRLLGYEVFRFGGFEFINENSVDKMVLDFFSKLFLRYEIN
ncbi:AbiJ-related protein [Paenibacillus sp. FSL L8-0641]|uniref:AbiJ-related protein n=1 Tax=Paenibacillus sp. FSL L8-0641 TaxID=2921605 RepID=UPI0030F8CC80